MIKQNNKGFTLIEIIISIAVLSIISAIFLELFIKSDLVQTQGKNIDEMGFLSSNLLEALFAEDELAAFIESSKPQKQSEDGNGVQLEYYFNSRLQPTSEEESQYNLNLSIMEKESLKKGKIYMVSLSAFSKDKEEPFQVITHFYEKGGE